MLSLKTLLNPAPVGPETPRSFCSSPAASSPAFSTITDISTSAADRPIMPRLRLPKDPNNLTKSKLRGPVHYHPYEDLDEASMAKIRRFQVHPFGNIHESCLHIPYNSGKKDFFEKTGRESFEVFRYGFTVPGHDTEYAVMWDYNVGLVRMTPFFKCCQYGKTMPAKMLGLNPGLKDITHSITGGAIAAQGYWMPYQCARAVCATFCYHIAGALIPLFGPDFPADCTRPDSPDFGRMAIDPRLVTEATREAETARRVQMNSTASSYKQVTSYPCRDHTSFRNLHNPEERRFTFRPRLICDPTWHSDHETDALYHSAPNSASSNGSSLQAYMITSRPTSGWTAANTSTSHHDNFPQASPWLSAVPRIAPLQGYSNFPTTSWDSKRPSGHGEPDEKDYYCNKRQKSDGIPGCIEAPLTVVPPRTPESPMRLKRKAEARQPDAVQENAARLLLNLGMKQQALASTRAASPPVGSLGLASPVSLAGDGRRSKRLRAASF